MKKIITVCAVALSVSLPLSVNAMSLLFINNTNFDSTTKIKGACSTKYLGDYGITHAHQSRAISSLQIKAACGFSFPCDGDVYLSRDCTGPVIAKGTFTLTEGVQRTTDLIPEKYRTTVRPDGNVTTLIIDPVA